MLDTSSYLDPWEGNSRGGVGANHQGDEGGTQVPEHAGQLEREETENSEFHSITICTDRAF